MKNDKGAAVRRRWDMFRRARDLGMDVGRDTKVKDLERMLETKPEPKPRFVPRTILRKAPGDPRSRSGQTDHAREQLRQGRMLAQEQARLERLERRLEEEAARQEKRNLAAQARADKEADAQRERTNRMQQRYLDALEKIGSRQQERLEVDPELMKTLGAAMGQAFGEILLRELRGFTTGFQVRMGKRAYREPTATQNPQAQPGPLEPSFGEICSPGESSKNSSTSRHERSIDSSARISATDSSSCPSAAQLLGPGEPLSSSRLTSTDCCSADTLA